MGRRISKAQMTDMVREVLETMVCSHDIEDEVRDALKTVTLDEVHQYCGSGEISAVFDVPCYEYAQTLRNVRDTLQMYAYYYCGIDMRMWFLEMVGDSGDEGKS